MVFIAVYALLPTFLARFCGLGVISRLPLKDRVVITFDDGPDPRYTPRVLDILRRSGSKACFFVVGEKARRHPDLIRQIFTDGHEIGSHGFSHRFPWLLGPLATSREISRSSRVIEEITGSPPVAYRPPWGLFNLFYCLGHLTASQRVVLWSFMSWDWTGAGSTETIERKVRQRIIDGSILIFHDSDSEPGASPGSPEKMISALPGIIRELQQRGYKTALLGDLRPVPDHRPGLLPIRLWRAWDFVFRLALGIRDLTDGGRPTIFRLAARRYHGPRVLLPGGETLRPGQKICELHLNNDYLAQCLKGRDDPGRIGMGLARELRRSLPALAGRLWQDPAFKDAGHLVGITMLHRASVAAGFTPLEIPSPLARKLLQFYQGLVLKVYHPSAKGRHYGKGDLIPKLVVMSKATLFSRYLEPGKERGGPLPNT